MPAKLDQPSILLVEDSANDVLLTEEALRHGKMARSLHVVSDGEAALDFLHGRGRYENAARPDLVLLDLNLPRMGGIEVLEDMKRSPELRTIPVVALTTSDAEGDVLKAYHRHINAYVTKPLDVNEFIQTVRSVEEFFLKTARRPRLRFGFDPLALPLSPG